MRTIAYVCADPGVPVFGTKGASVHVQEIIRAWRTRGARVRIYCTRVGDDRPADLADVEVIHRRVPRPDPGLDADAATAAREQAQQAAAQWLADQVIADGADLVYERYSLFSTALAEISDRTGAPGVLEVNSPLIEEQQQHRHLVNEAAARSALRTQLSAATRVAAVSQPVADWLRDHDVDPTRLVVAPNGVNPDRIVRVAPGSDPVVLFVGTLKPWHGTENLIRAAALARPPWQLRIIGDGPEAPRLRELADQLGISVDFRGAVAPADVPAAMAGARVAVAPYPELTGSAQYFSPLKVYEYAAAGLPVVASAVGQLPEVVLPGTTGLLVPPSEPEVLATAINELLADPERAQRMGDAGRSLMLRQHTWDHVLGRVIGDELLTDLDPVSDLRVG